ncbi:MAG TPA: ubiquinol-cytochrome C chaperone family protein [Phenylobacterium sp.]|nr:ubiquinol-cytochrome C chaperone family protein [Phenylobacterium sp.]
MVLKKLFRPRPSEAAGRALYAAAVEQARTPALYAGLKAPDTVEGRFELYSLHVLLLIERLRGEGTQAAETSQALFDTYASSLDDALREMGVGDLSVGKKMRRLAEAFYGRAKSYDAASDRAGLEAFLQRTVYAGDGAAPVGGLADYVEATRAHLAAQPLEPILAGEVRWPAI